MSATATAARPASAPWNGSAWATETQGLTGAPGPRERVLEVDPYNPGANHLFIHAVEPSDDKERGIEAAKGIKDAEKMTAFLEGVRRVDNS